MDSLISTTQGQVILGVGTLATIVSMFATPSIMVFIISILTYASLAFNATCLAKGGCNTWSWMTIAIPLIITVIHVYVALRPKPHTEEPAHK